MTKPQRANELAILGGQPMIPNGPPAWPRENDAVTTAVNAALADGSWGKYHGGLVSAFAQQLAKTFGREHAKPVCSGTFAVELALRSLGVQAGDEVILAAYDFAGNFRAVEAVGAFPVLVDIVRSNWSLNADDLQSAYSPKTKAVIASHLHGGLADLPTIVQWAQQQGVAVIEDACQTHGGTLAGRPVGSWGDVSVLSFGGSKLMTAGRGGAILTDDPAVLQRAKVFCEQGNDAFPLSSLQAAALTPQLGQLPAATKLRFERATELLELLTDVDCLKAVAISPGSAFFKIGFWFDGAAHDVSRAAFIAACQAEGVGIDAGFRGFAKRSARRCRAIGDLPVAKEASEQTLVLHHPILLQPSDDIQAVASAIRKVTAQLDSLRGR